MRDFCQDYNLQCSEWALLGECKRNAKFMKNNCPMSCGYCTGQPRCKIKESERKACSAKAEDHCVMKGCCWRKDQCYLPIGNDMNIVCTTIVVIVSTDESVDTMDLTLLRRVRRRRRRRSV